MSYKESLDGVARSRYQKKLELIGLGTCPYELEQVSWTDDVTLWPPVEFPDIVFYLLQTPGVYTREKLKAYKSLGAYNYFVSGLVLVTTTRLVASFVFLKQQSDQANDLMRSHIILGWV